MLLITNAGMKSVMFASSENYCCRAFFFRETGEYVRAESDARSALLQDPTSGLAHYIMAKCDIAHGRYESARLLLNHLMQEHVEACSLLLKTDIRELDLLQSLVSHVNQSFLRRDWSSVYHTARLILLHSPLLSGLHDLQILSLHHVEQDPGYRDKRDLMMHVRRALDLLVPGKGQPVKDYRKILRLDAGWPHVPADEEVKQCYAKAFVRSIEDESLMQDVEEAYHFMLHPQKRILYMDWADDPLLFDPRDLTCYTITD